MTDEQIELLRTKAFGDMVSEFWSSGIGAYLRTQAQELYNAALEEFKTVDPTDAKSVMRVQNNMRVAEYFEEWLNSAIIQGIKALELLEGIDDED